MAACLCVFVCVCVCVCVCAGRETGEERIVHYMTICFSGGTAGLRLALAGLELGDDAWGLLFNSRGVLVRISPPVGLKTMLALANGVLAMQ